MGLKEKLLKIKTEEDNAVVPISGSVSESTPPIPPDSATGDSFSPSKDKVDEEVFNFKDKFSEQEKEEPNPLAGVDKEFGVSSLQRLAESVVNPPTLAEELFNIDKDIESKTRLSPELVAQIAIAKQMSLAHNIPMLDDFANNIMKLRISLLGEGRKEGVDMVKGQNLVGFTNDFAQRTKG